MSYVFISYSKKDKVYTDQLVDQLFNEGFDVWLDRGSLFPSENWWTAIVHAVWGCEAFIVVLSSNSDSSDYVQREIAVAERRGKPLFPILLDGTLSTPNWNFFLRTQVEDVSRDQNLPGSAFYQRLSLICKPHAGHGSYVDNIPEVQSGSLEDREALQAALVAAPLPEPSSTSTTTVTIATDIIHKENKFLKILGEGGMGTVWLAYQTRVNREVAIKVIKTQHANSPDFIRRFEYEAQLVARLEHPNIVPLYDFWREPDGAFLVMRFLRGGSLQDRFEAGAQSPQKVLSWLSQITSALALSHRQGIVHRDIKPANILFDEAGNAYLADFGLAKQIGHDDEAEASGSFGYAAPEQLRGIETTELADIFSLGVVLYELLTGQRGFASPDWLLRVLNDPLPDIRETMPSLPETLNFVIQRATAKDPDDRYESATILLNAYHDALDIDVPLDPIELDVTTEFDFTLDIPNPYKGLRAFQEADAGEFFGRATLIERIVQRLSQPESEARFLAVIGPSGSGKSSVVKAGLIPALRQDAIPGSANWFVIDVFPGARPFEELEAELLRIAVNPPGSLLEQLKAEHGISRAIKRILPDDDNIELLLVIDQFEELFTQTPEDIREAFLTGLLDALDDPRSRLRVVITLRADFYDQPLYYRDFGELLRKRTEVVLPLNDTELQDAIVTPAEIAGAHFESGLVETIVNDVGNEPGILPLLQYALTELYDKRDGRMLTHSAYHALGGITGAIAKRADEEFERVDGTNQDVVRQIFLRLVTLGEGTEDTRRRVRRSELGDTSAIQSVLDAYSHARLLTGDRDPETREATIEVAHEALIRTWERLHAWIENSREDLRIQRRLTLATREWVDAGEDPGFLAIGARLAQFEAWRTETDLKLNIREQAYLDASLHDRDAREAREEARKAHELFLQQQASNRLRYLAGVLIAGIFIAFALSLFAFDQRGAAQTNASNAQTQASIALVERDRADQSARIAQSREIAVQALVALDDNEVDRALLLSAEAFRIADTYEARNSLLTSLVASPRLITMMHGHNDDVWSVAFSPDGQRIASGSKDQSISVWDATIGEAVFDPLVGHTGFVHSVAFSPDGSRIASASSDGSIMLWDANTGNPIGLPLVGHGDEVWSLAFSPDGQLLASGAEDGQIILWDVASGESIGEPFDAHLDNVYALAFSPDGETLASGGGDNLIRLWDVGSQQPIEALIDHTNWVLSVAFSPDGRLLASGSADNTIRLWDVQTRQPIGTPLTDHTDWVRSVDFSPDGEQLVSGSVDGFVLLWDVETSIVVDGWRTEDRNGVWSVGFSPDGQNIVTGGTDNTVVLWSTESRYVSDDRFSNHTGIVYDIGFNSALQQFVSAGSDGTLIMRTTADLGVSDDVSFNVSDVISVGMNLDAGIVAFGAIDGSITLWDIESRQQLGQPLLGHTSLVFDLAFSPDGNSLASGDDEGVIMLWDVQSGQPMGEPLMGHSQGIQALAFNPNGDTLASPGKDNTIILWDTETRQPIGESLTLHNDRILDLTFSLDGRLLASGDRMGQIIVWDMDGEQPPLQLTAPDDEVFSLAFSPDSQILASAGRNQTIVLWDMNNYGILGQPLRGHTAWIESLMFSADGNLLASGDRDGAVIVWDLNIDSWIARACRLANRNLTQIEWERFIPDEAYRTTCSP
ncbi:MAG: protein kinase [Aggregatilineales bacterium]